VLLVGLGLALWQSGILRRMDPIWIAIAAIIAVGIGVMGAVTAGKPAITEERR
jgi:ABC-type nitrate/sulfonate/bicarbonate transport system permease component